jgi:hypothetical protein
MIHAKFYNDDERITYPVVYNIDAKSAHKINDVMLDAAQKSYAKFVAVKAAEKKLIKAELCKPTMRCKYAFNSLYQVKYNKNDKLSIYYSEYTYTGGKKGTSKVTMYNFSLKTGKRYTLSDILHSKKDYQRVWSALNSMYT